MYAYALGGFVLLFGGGEWLVRGAVAVSRRFGLSPLLIGMTVVAWCTSAPELVVSFGAALEGQSDIAIGNVVGSNIFNIMVVLGASALIVPVVVRPTELRRDMAVMLGSTTAVALVAQTGEIGRVVGAVFLLAIAAYIVLSYRAELKNPQLPSAELHLHEAEEVECPPSMWAGIGYLVLGLAALVLGARLLITGAAEIARGFGISEAVIGLTVVAALRKHSDVAVGNVVGSNTFNVLGILGITSVVHPIEVAEQIARVDVWVMLAVSAAAALVLLLRGRIGRVVGALALVAYAGYVVLLLA
jgi:cation:H+ antiporter